MSMIWPFDGIENNHNVNGGQDCIKKFFEFLRADAMKKINFEKKKMIPLTNKQQEFNEKTKICNICQNSSNINTLMIKTIVKL